MILRVLNIRNYYENHEEYNVRHNFNFSRNKEIRDEFRGFTKVIASTADSNDAWWFPALCLYGIFSIYFFISLVSTYNLITFFVNPNYLIIKFILNQ